MTDENDDEGRSTASVSTYYEADHGGESVLYVSDWGLIEENSPHFRNLEVTNWLEDEDDEDVEPSSITREDWIQLGRAIGGNPTITRLLVWVDDHGDGDPIQSIDVRDAYCTGLARSRSIQVFRNSGLHYTSAQMEIMRPFFSESADLNEIGFDSCGLESDAIHVLMDAIKERGGNVKTIRSFAYSGATVSPSHTIAIVELAKTCTRLTSLTLSELTGGFDLSSCQAIASFLAGKNCMLRDLSLNGNPINDAGCRVIAESLRINRRLRRLDIDNDEITSMGFESFIPVVCDASTIQSTLNSNHTLELVTTFGYKWRVPWELEKLLDMNRNDDTKIAVELKVLRSHFSGNFDLKATAGLDAKVLPHLLAWFGRECTEFDEEKMCLSALYRISRHAPELCGYPSYERVARLKAEDQVTTLEQKLIKAEDQVMTLEHKFDVAETRIEKLQLANEAMERELKELRQNMRGAKDVGFLKH